MNRPVIIIGAGGHAKVVIDALLLIGIKVFAAADIDPARRGQSILSIPIIGEDRIAAEHAPDSVMLANGIGSTGNPKARRAVFYRFKKLGYVFRTVIHPSAVIARDVEIGEGCQIMAGVVIQTGVRTGINSIINTRSSVDHDCRIGDHVHIAPGVTLSGAVIIGDGAHLGSGATVIQECSIGNDCIIAAGAVVVDNVAPGIVVRGVPAKKAML
ncbi:MAG: sugar acetyltransferase [Rhodospirillales bacterium RIFCSPLOWO2_12_FULL_58_28]|nr:MAG: sugar acetyltransferase [Rhodospirillales bacterium RIFCSPLOWO2_02_FULL_58_16]OHC76731.1 MAG: sugar acetyltransferase [Rhodospirillales bacterium RIFCSPLOWO2_12_FULL_58_28]